MRPLSVAPLVSPNMRVVKDRAHALRVAVPRGWYLGRVSLTPTLAPPASILAAATFPPRADRRRACGLWPDMPQVEIGPKDALVHVGEELDAQPGRLPLRPRRFRLLEQVRRSGFDEPVRSVFPWRCLNRPGIAGVYSSFRAHGRLLHLTAVAGERTSRRVRGQLLGVIEGLRFGPPPPVGVRVSPTRGDPDTMFELEIVAGERSGRRGRRLRRYWAEVRGPRAFACVIEHDAGFGYGPPGARLRAKLDPSRTKGLRWCRGRFRGVVKYRDGYGCPPRGRCRPPDDFPTEQRTAGRFAFTVH